MCLHSLSRCLLIRLLTILAFFLLKLNKRLTKSYEIKTRTPPLPPFLPQNSLLPATTEWVQDNLKVDPLPDGVLHIDRYTSSPLHFCHYI